MEGGRWNGTYGCESRMPVFTLFVDLVSVLGVFLSELKEPVELVIIVFLAHVDCGKYIINFEINDIKRGDKDLLAAVDKLAPTFLRGVFFQEELLTMFHMSICSVFVLLWDML